jgi:hypothetical protein
MPRVEREIVINRPLEEVFDFVADGRTEPQYNAHMVRAEQTPDGPVTRGTRYRTEMRTMGRSMEMAYEVTDHERPRRRGTRLTRPLPVMDLEATEAYDPVPGGTRVRWSWEVRPRGVFRLVPALLTRTLGRDLDAVFGNLKRVLEARAAPLPSASAE